MYQNVTVHFRVVVIVKVRFGFVTCGMQPLRTQARLPLDILSRGKETTVDT